MVHTPFPETHPVDVVVSEVGPRDGLQNASGRMPTPSKIAWIEALVAAGLQEIEIGSFVSPRLLPQMADTGEVMNHFRNDSSATFLSLVPNLRGANDALVAGSRALSIPVSASRSHSQANVGKSPEEMVEQVRLIRKVANEQAQPVSVEVGISTAFGCSIEGTVPEDWVIELAEHCVEAGADSVGLSDTTGSANPAQVKRLFSRLYSQLGDKAGAAHLHNTRGQGLANVVAALEVGVRTFDSSQGGLGGCPYAPGASGNVVTEDLIYMLESMGLRTGVNIDALLTARELLVAGLPEEPIYGHVPEAGVAKGFEYA